MVRKLSGKDKPKPADQTAAFGIMKVDKTGRIVHFECGHPTHTRQSPELSKNGHAAARHPEPMKMMAQAGLRSGACYDRNSTLTTITAFFFRAAAAAVPGPLPARPQETIGK